MGREQCDGHEIKFSGAYQYNQDLDLWDASCMLYMDSKFSNAQAFNGDEGPWDVSTIDTLFAAALRTDSAKQRGYLIVLKLVSLVSACSNVSSVMTGEYANALFFFVSCGFLSCPHPIGCTNSESSREWRLRTPAILPSRPP